MTEATAMTEEEYLACGGGQCPFCRSTDITGDTIEVDGTTAWQPVVCNECDAEWQDNFNLTGYQKA